MRDLIEYNFSEKRVKHRLLNLSIYELEGNLDNTIKQLESYKTCYIGVPTTQHIPIPKQSYHAGYIDGVSKKQVTFDKLHLSIDYGYDNDNSFILYGERDFDATELQELENRKKLEKEKKKREKQEKEEQRKKLYLELKEEFEDNE